MTAAAVPTRVASAILPGGGGVRGALSDAFWRRPKLLLLLMLLPPVLWLGIVYIGSLIALLLQSFFSIDEFSGLINRQFTLSTYGDLFQAANLDIIVRTVTMAALVTLAAAVGRQARSAVSRRPGRPSMSARKRCRSAAPAMALPSRNSPAAR